ncbi:hypothetical protein ACFL3S_11490, partial [Gemmatimonadota bacterium]
SQLLESLPLTDEGRAADGTCLDIAAQLMPWVLGPLRALDPAGILSHQRRKQHLTAMLSALALAIPESGANVPSDDLLESLKSEATDGEA